MKKPRSVRLWYDPLVDRVKNLIEKKMTRYVRQ